MGIRGEDDRFVRLRQLFQDHLGRVGRCTVSARDGARVDLEYRGGLEQLFHRVVLRFYIPCIGHVDEVVPFDEFGDEVEVRDDVAAGLPVEVSHQPVIVLHKGHGVSGVPLLDPAALGLSVTVDRDVVAVFEDAVDPADDVLVKREVAGVAAVVLLDAEEDLHLPLIVLFQGRDGLPVTHGGVRFHRPHRVELEPGMAGKADLPAPEGKGGFRHLLRAVCAVAVFGVGVEVVETHTIFSCLTLWSMMCRDASSFRTSDTVMPMWTMRTITWYMRSAIS